MIGSPVTTGVFIGRFQPFHEGHRRCVGKILEQRDRGIILAHFPDSSRVEILTIQDPGADLSVFIGRDVGYDLIELDAATEAISATDLRKKMYAEAGKAFNHDAPRN